MVSTSLYAELAQRLRTHTPTALVVVIDGPHGG